MIGTDRIVGYVVEHADGSTSIETTSTSEAALREAVRADLYALYGLLAGELDRANREARGVAIERWRAARARRLAEDHETER